MKISFTRWNFVLLVATQQPLVASSCRRSCSALRILQAPAKEHLRCSIVVSISACHAEDLGSIPGGGVFAMLRRLLHRSARGQIPLHKRDRSLCCLLRVPCSRCASVCKQIVWLPSFDQHDKVACRGESGWCSDMTSTHGAWRHAEVQFLLPGGFFSSSQR